MLAGVAAAWNSSCAITTDDEAFPLLCWGANNQAQLGLPQYYDPKGTPPDPLPPPPNIEFTAEPVSAPDAPWFATIAAGGECGCGLDRAGGVWCWGDANDGCLADENETGNDGKALHVGLSAAATRLAMGGTEVSVNTGTGVGEKGTACAVIGEGSVVCWGNNLTGQADPRAATAQDRVIVPFAIPILPLP